MSEDASIGFFFSAQVHLFFKGIRVFNTNALRRAFGALFCYFTPPIWVVTSLFALMALVVWPLFWISCPGTVVVHIYRAERSRESARLDPVRLHRMPGILPKPPACPAFTASRERC